MKILHVVPGTGDISNGMAVVARFIAKEQGDAEVVDLNQGACRCRGNDVEKIWVHGMWLPKEWRVCWLALKSGRKLVRMTHGSLSPLYLKHQSPFKKWLVGPIERYFLRRCSKIVATCEAEKDWIAQYLGKRCPSVEVTDIKRFFNLNPGNHVNLVKDVFHLLYLGRRHPLKGCEFLEQAVSGIGGVELRIVSNAFGDEKEKAWNWCDVLVLPTLSENFGLVIAEALERGKRVITTDGAPAWGPEECENTEMLPVSNSNSQSESQIWKGYGGRLTYLRGYRDGTDAERVAMLKSAIEDLICTR